MRLCEVQWEHFLLWDWKETITASCTSGSDIHVGGQKCHVLSWWGSNWVYTINHMKINTWKFCTVGSECHCVLIRDAGLNLLCVTSCCHCSSLSYTCLLWIPRNQNRSFVSFQSMSNFEIIFELEFLKVDKINVHSSVILVLFICYYSFIHIKNWLSFLYFQFSFHFSLFVCAFYFNE